MPKREPPNRYMSDGRGHDWIVQGIADLADGKHAVGCECFCEFYWCAGEKFSFAPNNACLTLARKLRDFEEYEVEEEREKGAGNA